MASWIFSILGLLTLLGPSMFSYTSAISPYIFYTISLIFILLGVCFANAAKKDEEIVEIVSTKMPEWWLRELVRKEMNVFLRDLNNPDGRTQTNAIIRLGNMGDESAIPHLEKLLRKKSKSIRELVEIAITKIKGRTSIINVCAYLQIESQIRDRTIFFYHKIMKDKKSATIISNNIILAAFCLIMAVREYKDLTHISDQDVIKGFNHLTYEITIGEVFELALNLLPKYDKMFNRKTLLI